MIDFGEILEAAQVEAMQGIFNGAFLTGENSEVNVQKAQMKFALELLEQYHKALQQELAKYQIEI